VRLRVNLVVFGADRVELERAAAAELARLDPDAEWTVQLSLDPQGQTLGGEITLWKAEVDAHAD
jgi:hypothetical protein